MATALAKAAPLKPEIRLAQAISEFEAALDDDQKPKFWEYRRDSPPVAADVVRLTSQIDMDEKRRRFTRQCGDQADQYLASCATVFYSRRYCNRWIAESHRQCSLGSNENVLQVWSTKFFVRPWTCSESSKPSKRLEMESSSCN